MFDKLRAVFQDPDVSPYETAHPAGDAIWDVPLAEIPASDRARLGSLDGGNGGRPRPASSVGRRDRSGGSSRSRKGR